MVQPEAKQTDTTAGDIPVISLSALQQHDPQAISALDDACRNWGFFKLTDHGIDAQARGRFLDCMRNYFALPRALKKACERTEENPWGFYDRELTKNRQDWKEIFDLGIDQADDRYISRTPWPAEPAGFREIMLDWHGRCETIGVELVRAISRALGLSGETLTRCFQPLNSSFLRLNYYPVCNEPADAREDFPEDGYLGISHHTDAGAVTVLLQGDVDGLEVRRDNRWITVKSDPDALIINIGDMIQVWSNDRYRAPLHRVLANSRVVRYSAAFFLNPSFATDCKPLVDGNPLYSAVNWGEFRAGRAAGDYANIGQEIQISDFRIQPGPD